MEKYVGTLGFELEVNIVDNDGKIVNYIDGNIASTQILHLLEGRSVYKKLTQIAGGKIVKPELDASQLEIYNPFPKDCLQRCQDELAETFRIIENIVTGYGLYLANIVVPNQEFIPVHSNAVERYKGIHDKLMSVSQGHRKSTNITGTHINYLAGDNFENHIAITQFVREKLFANDWRAIGASPERVKHYINVVSALVQLGFVKHGHIPHEILTPEDVKSLQISDKKGEEGEALFSYELVRLKSLDVDTGKLYISELRTVDGPTSFEDVYKKTQKAYDILEESLENYQATEKIHVA